MKKESKISNNNNSQSSSSSVQQSQTSSQHHIHLHPHQQVQHLHHQSHTVTSEEGMSLPVVTTTLWGLPTTGIEPGECVLLIRDDCDLNGVLDLTDQTRIIIVQIEWTPWTMHWRYLINLISKIIEFNEPEACRFRNVYTSVCAIAFTIFFTWSE